MQGPHIEVDGLRDLRRSLSSAEKGIKRQLPKMMQDSAKPVLPIARSESPARTGVLKRRLRITRSASGAALANSTRYAGPIEYGHPARNIRPSGSMQESVDKGLPEVEDRLAENLDNFNERFFHA